MTNKLRSVIEEANADIEKQSQPRDVMTNQIMLIDSYNAKEILNESIAKLLDAIIEEMKGSRLPNIDKTHSIHNHVLNEQIQKLKQAREELSTSLTQ